MCACEIGGETMRRRFRLVEVEEAVAEMDFSEIDDDLVETDEDMQLVISGWFVYIESLNMSLREGIVCVWDEEEQMFMPDFAVTVFYEGNIETREIAAGDWMYFEQDGFTVSLGNWLNRRLSKNEIEQLWCELIIPKNIKTSNDVEKVEE